MRLPHLFTTLAYLALLPGMVAAPKPAKVALPAPVAVLGDAAVFRKAGSGKSLSKAISYFDGGTALKFLTSTKSYKQGPALWSYFLSGTVLLGGNLESPNPVVGFYNPFLDGVLLTQWEARNGKSRIVAADLRVASEWAGQKSADPNLAYWIPAAAKRPVPVVLREQYAAFTKAFSSTYPVASPQSAPLTTSANVAQTMTFLERQAYASFSNLANFQNPKSPAFSPELAALKQAVRSGDVPGLGKLMPAGNAAKPQEIASQPAWVRKEIVPIYAMAGTNRMTVILSPASTPRYALVATWVRTPKPHMELLFPVDLDATQPVVPGKAVPAKPTPGKPATGKAVPGQKKVNP